MFPGFTILSVTLKGDDVIRHYLWWNRKCYLWVSIKTPNHHHSWLQFSVSHHTLQHTNSITKPFTCPNKWNTSTCTNILVGGGGGGVGLWCFHTYVGSDPFWAFKIFKFQYFRGIFMYIYINESTPPPHTHTQILGIHVRLSAPGFGAHRICACADPDFHLFSSAYFTEGPICLGPLPVSFFF